MAVSQSIEMGELSSVGKDNIGKQQVCLLNSYCQLVVCQGTYGRGRQHLPCAQAMQTVDRVMSDGLQNQRFNLKGRF